MPETQTQQRVHPPGEITAMAEAGITQNPNGSYMLPPVLVQYRDGVYQTLVIEVSNSERQPTIANLWNLARQARNRAQAQTTQNSDTNQPVDGAATTAAGAVAGAVAGADSNRETAEFQLANIFQNAAGLPMATEAERESSERQLASRLIDPLQRLLDQMVNRNTNNNTETPTTVPENNSTTTGTTGTSAAETATTSTSTSTTTTTTDTTGTTGTTENTTPTNIPADENQTAGEPRSNSEIELRFPGDSRNIILTVNYIQGAQGNENGSGSLLLYVPSIVETGEENVQLLVRLATEIALRTISTLLQKSAGVAEKVFKSLEVKKLSDLKPSEQECSICYDSYVEKESEVDTEKSKKRTLDDSNELPAKKKLKTNNEESVNTTNEENAKKKNDNEFTHYPIVLKCDHTFGASCLHEWFKTNSTCPLCREKLPNLAQTESNQQDVQVTLPNLASIIRLARPFIDNLNNREMIFHFREDDQETIDRILNADVNSSILSPAVNQTLIDTLTSLRPLTTTGTTPPAHLEVERRRPPTGATSILNFVRDLISNMRRDNRDTQSGEITFTSPQELTRRIASPRAMGVASRRTENGVETIDNTMFSQQSRNTGSNANEESSNLVPLGSSTDNDYNDTPADTDTDGANNETTNPSA